MRVYIHSFKTHFELDLIAVSNNSFSLGSVIKSGLNLKVAKSLKAFPENVFILITQNF